MNVRHEEIHYVAYLSPDGTLTQPLPDRPGLDERLLVAYRTMVLVRIFDQKAVALQRTGQLGTYASILGQEAVSAAVGLVMQPVDVLVPYYRDYAAQYLRGVRLAELLTYWGGDERGNDFSGPKQDLPMCVPVATQANHAVGVAAAMKIRREHRVAVTTCGDGATSKGDFLEALNLAGVWHLPVVFVVNNNQYAISVPRSAQSAAVKLADKAIGAGIHGVQVDGNDTIALLVAIDDAVARARANKGATLVEAVTYRLSDHTTADDASRYRDADEVKDAWEREPIKRLRTYLVAAGLWSEAQELALVDACEAEVANAVEDYLALPPQPPGSLFDFHYAELPRALAGQREHAVRKAERLGANDG